MAWRWPGDKPLSEPRMESLLIHICFTQPQWVKIKHYHKIYIFTDVEVFWSTLCVMLFILLYAWSSSAYVNSMFFSCDRATLRTPLSVCPSFCLSVCLSHLFHYVPVIVSSRNFQDLLPVTKVTSMQKVKVRGQRSRSQRSTANLAVSGP